MLETHAAGKMCLGAPQQDLSTGLLTLRSITLVTYRFHQFPSLVESPLPFILGFIKHDRPSHTDHLHAWYDKLA